MGQSHQVTFAPQALRDLEAIVRFIARHASSETAARVGFQLVEKALSLSLFPERGRVVPEIGSPYHEIIFKSYRIVFRLSKGKVEIIRFWHAARGEPQIDSDEFGQNRSGD